MMLTGLCVSSTPGCRERRGGHPPLLHVCCAPGRVRTGGGGGEDGRRWERKVPVAGLALPPEFVLSGAGGPRKRKGPKCPGRSQRAQQGWKHPASLKTHCNERQGCAVVSRARPLAAGRHPGPGVRKGTLALLTPAAPLPPSSLCPRATQALSTRCFAPWLREVYTLRRWGLFSTVLGLEVRDGVLAGSFLLRLRGGPCPRLLSAPGALLAVSGVPWRPDASAFTSTWTSPPVCRPLCPHFPLLQGRPSYGLAVHSRPA